jgi:hypothetical protein
LRHGQTLHETINAPLHFVVAFLLGYRRESPVLAYSNGAFEGAGQ